MRKFNSIQNMNSLIALSKYFKWRIKSIASNKTSNL
jgi:hypothetical protein